MDIENEIIILKKVGPWLLVKTFAVNLQSSSLLIRALVSLFISHHKGHARSRESASGCAALAAALPLLAVV